MDDWNTEKMLPLEFFSKFRGGQIGDYGTKNSVTMYMTWDEEHLYWVARITDDVLHTGGKYMEIWPNDCLHLCIYPWELSKGGTVRGIAYKDHCGIDEDGQSTIDRVQSPVEPAPGTTGWWPKDTQFVAKKTDDGYIYECSFSRAALAPLEFKPGTKFRMAATYWDNDQKTPHEKVMWYWGTGNVEGDIDSFGQLTLIE